jgi:DNA excision repair protein ERCC-5
VTTTGDDIPEDVVYYGELGQDSSATIRAGHKPFRPTDQYHLPDITSKAVVASDDPRLLTEDEMEEYAKMFQDQARSGLMDVCIAVGLLLSGR